MNSSNFAFDFYSDFENFGKQPDKKTLAGTGNQQYDPTSAFMDIAKQEGTNLIENGQVFSSFGKGANNTELPEMNMAKGSEFWSNPDTKFQSNLDGKEINKAAAGGGGFNMASAGAIAGAIGNAIPQDGYNSKYEGTNMEGTVQAMESTKDAVASVIPMAGVFRGVEKAAKGIGYAVGGERGGDIVGGIVDPATAQVELLKNEDATTGEKMGAFLAPFMSGALAGAARRRSMGKKFSKLQNKIRDQKKEALEKEFREKELDEEIKAQIALRKKQSGYTL